MDRRTTLKGLGAVAGAAMAGGASARALAAPPIRRPNVILIVVDDLRWDEYGAGGHPYLKTPNIDRLAREGVTFANTFHATPLCSPNRACILTGEYASTHGIYNNVDRTRMSFLLRTVTRHLHDGGYQTAHVGKWHMGDDPRPRPGYDYWSAFPAQGRMIDPELWEDGRLHTVPGYITDVLTDRAVTFLRGRDRAKPFFLYFGHKAVHPDLIQRNDASIDLSRGSSYVPASRHAGRYGKEVYRRAPSAVGPVERRPKSPMIAHFLAAKNTPEMAKELPGVLDPGVSEDTIRLRAEMMLSVDESVGTIVKTLEAAGELDNTVVIFTSDNGFFFGEHGLSVERRLPYEESIRMPVLIRYPPLAKAGAKVTELGSSIDIAPTILDLANLPVPSHIEGKSMKRALDGASAAHGRSGVLIEYYSHDYTFPWVLDADYKAVRTHDRKYIHWIQFPEYDELYDMATDPFEVTNLANDPASAPALKAMKQQLAALIPESIALKL